MNDSRASMVGDILLLKQLRSTDISHTYNSINSKNYFYTKQKNNTLQKILTNRFNKAASAILSDGNCFTTSSNSTTISANIIFKLSSKESNNNNNNNMHFNTCINCGRAIRNIKESKSCFSCKKLIHKNCDSSLPSTVFNCLTCREKSLMDGEANDSVMPCVATENSVKFFSGGTGGLESDEDELDFVHSPPSIIRRQSTRNVSRRKISPLNNTIYNVGCSTFSENINEDQSEAVDDELFNGCHSSHNQCLLNNNVDFFSNVSFSNETTESAGCSLRDDSLVLHKYNNENRSSDIDEYKPPTLKQSTRGKRNSQGKKKPNLSRQASTMKTRSGGKPPVTSYAFMGSEDNEKSERGKRCRGGTNKGSGRGRRTGGRFKNSKFTSMSYLYASSSSAGFISHGSNKAEDSIVSDSSQLIDANKQNTITNDNLNDENDYIRTAIVTNASDKFMNFVSLCLICGSVGKDVEGTMITCASCAQSYHTFCVGMHDKLNSAVLKRGWRCLDCTVCEGCGDGKDESNLLLCDECDVSFHIYCLDPPLEKIPHGSWRCKWCAMCCRCNKKVLPGLDLQRLEGLCETCFSLRKCLKCNKLYDLGQILIKCQRCIRWFHANCENLITEEQVENAAENAFRCSFCRPQLSSTFNDVISTSLIVDNVMVDKNMAEKLQHNRKFNTINGSIHSETLGISSRNQSYDNDENDNEDGSENSCNLNAANRGRGLGLIGSRGGGPGRRMLKIGIGGFNVKIPRHRLLAINTEDQDAFFSGNGVGDDLDNIGTTLNGKPRIRRPRKLRKPQLEDAYPAPIQELFFGFAAVDSRSLAEQIVNEPVLGEYKRSSLDFFNNKTGCELSEQSSELLRAEQEQDMLGDIFSGGIDLDFDLDLNDIMDSADKDDINDENVLLEDSLTDGFSATGSTGLITGMCSPTTSAIGLGESHFSIDDGGQGSPHTPNVYKGDSASMQHHLQMQQDDQRKRQQQLQNRIGANLPSQRFTQQNSDLNLIEKTVAVSQATERWEEDEPLGDKATKAAVLYANLCHPHLKVKYPQWSERVKQINREWRTLDAEKRQVYVDMARKNRANSGIIRRRTRRRFPTVNSSNNCLSSSLTSNTDFSNSLSFIKNDEPSSNASVFANKTDLVNAHVNAIKQAQARVLQTEQKKNFIESSNIQSTTTEQFKLPGAMSENNIKDIINVKISNNNDNDSVSESTDYLQKKSSNEFDAIISKQKQSQLVASEKYSLIKNKIMCLEREYQEHENELAGLRKSKKNLTIKHRRLIKNQIKEMESNDELVNEYHSVVEQKLNSNKIQSLNPCIEEANRCIEEAKFSIQSRTKQLDKCKQELKEQSILLQEFEAEKMSNLSFDELTNGVSLKSNNFQPNEKEHNFENNANLNFNENNLLLKNSSDSINNLQHSFNSNNNVQKAAFQTKIHQQQSQFSDVKILLKDNNFGSFVNKKIQNNESLLSGASDSNSLLNLKSGRGRKRKKLTLDEMCSPTLRNIKYSTFKDQIECDVYDVIDSIINHIVMNNEKGNDILSIKRILCSSQVPFQNDSINVNNSVLYTQDSIEQPKIKKKRQQIKKQITNDFNEYEVILERIQSQLDAIQFPKRSLDQYSELDRNILFYPSMTYLFDRPGKNIIEGNKIGNYSFSFMPDFYATIELGKVIEESSLFPKSMAEIYSNVNMNALISYSDSDLDDSDFIENYECKKSDDFYFKKSDLLYLSVSNLSDRSKIKSSSLLLGPCHIEKQPSYEPHRSIFYKDTKDTMENEFKISLIVNAESVANTTELIENLKNILKLEQPIAFEIETPPESPPIYELSSNVTSNNFQSEFKTEIKDDEIESVETGICNIIKNELENNIKYCRNCEKKILLSQTNLIEETMSRLGLTPPDDAEKKVSFCSMKCYYKFMATCKVPLSVELLNRAEKYVDKETIEKLKQISADSFAKKIQQVQLASDQRLNIKTTFLTQAASLLSPSDRQNEQINFDNGDNILYLMRQPREQVIRASNLSNIVANLKNQNTKLIKTEYKWKGHSWMICDLQLLQSFQRPHDRYASINSEIHGENCVDRDEDTRCCILCKEYGDGDQELEGRLLNVDANEWIHVNCALWSPEVHETENGALLNVKSAIFRARDVKCLVCKTAGATLKCYKLDCINHNFGYHLSCAKRSNGRFIRDRTFFCSEHEVRQDMRVHRFDSLRRIYIQRDENQLLSKIFNHSYSAEMMMRVGSLIFHKIGQLLPEQLKTFHSENYIFPIGYRITRIFWSPTNPHNRLRFDCSIEDNNNIPEFVVTFDKKEFRNASCTGAWNKILLSVLQAREKTGNMLKFFPNQINGETLFGLTEPAITKMIESLPGVDQLYTYTFKHGGCPLMDLPLAVNPSGCARCEPCFRTLIKRRYRPLISASPKKQQLVQSNSFNAEVIPREARSTRAAARFQSMSSRIDQETLKAYKASGISEEMLTAPYHRFDLTNQNNHQIYSQYRRMQKEWYNNVYLARSKIQGLGLYAKFDIDMNSMIIEYKGEVIRNEVGETREKRYMSQNRGVYMFRIDDQWLIDATLAGGLARYINHSCDPNCTTKILQYNDDKKIVIIANRPIKAGEELTYDYQFEVEDTTDKLPCLCGAPNCIKWMN